MDAIWRMQSVNWVLMLLGLCLPLSALAASDCALGPGRPGLVRNYHGECLDGRVHGVAEVMLELPPAANGVARRARQFGWFQRGVPQGAHIVVATDPEGDAPGFAMLNSFDESGRTNWWFGLPSGYWPKGGSLLASGPWEDADGKAREAGLFYAVAQRADGSSYGEGRVMVADVVNLAVEFSLAAGVQSVEPGAVRKYLAGISIKQPLAGALAGLSANGIFPDTGEEAPAASAESPEPAPTPGLDELIRRAMEGNQK